MKKKTKNYWRKLDDQAKVFSLAANKKYSSIFRLSVTLKEKIEPKILQKALELALEKYKAFKVKLKKDFFWYYLEENKEKPKISKENEYSFKKVNTKENNDYLFRVTYKGNDINIYFFHALTDGNGGGEFLKELIYIYLELKHPEELKRTKLKEDEIVHDSENAYKKHYIKNIKKTNITKKAYRIQGEVLTNEKTEINDFNMSLEGIKNAAKQNGSTLSVFLVAMIAYSIFEGNYKINQGKRPINISVPINLKKYFKTETISNFFSYMAVTFNLNRSRKYSFEDILDMVKKEFEMKVKIEKILATITADAGKTNNIFVRIVPLIIKRLAVRIGSLNVKRHFTTTFSNIGIFEIDNKYEKYVEKFSVALSPDWAEKIKYGVCSYKNNLVITFGTIIKDRSIENEFKKLLKENDIQFSSY